MFREAFEKLEPSDVTTILDHLNPQFENAKFETDETTILGIDLAFYKNYKLLDIADHASMPAKRRHVLYKLDSSVILDFTNEPIYKLNKDLPIALTKKNIGDYLRFFFMYVRGKKGRFILVENIDDIRWREDPPPQARKAIGNMIVPLALIEVDKSGTYHLEACLTYKDALFKSQIHVTADGMVSLSDEELLIEDMPVLDDILGQ